MMTGEEMCEEIVRFLAPNADDEKRIELAFGIWSHSPDGDLGAVVSLYEWVRVQQMLRGEREQDAFPEDPIVGAQVLRVFLLPERRTVIVRRMTFTGSFWMRTQEWGNEAT